MFVLTLGIFSLLLLLNVCSGQDVYKNLVYTTRSCPKNDVEWKKRSSAINCTDENGYTCLPNDKLTELKEFCYRLARTQISKGVCLILYDESRIHYRKCTNFTDGCPDKVYSTDQLYKYPNCSEIENGCFLAEPLCDSRKSLSNLPEDGTTTDFSIQSSTNIVTTAWTMSSESTIRGSTSRDNNYWIWTVLPLAIIAAIVTLLFLWWFCFRRKNMQRFMKRHESRHIDLELHSNGTKATEEHKSLMEEHEEERDTSVVESYSSPQDANGTEQCRSSMERPEDERNTSGSDQKGYNHSGGWIFGRDLKDRERIRSCIDENDREKNNSNSISTNEGQKVKYNRTVENGPENRSGDIASQTFHQNLVKYIKEGNVCIIQSLLNRGMDFNIFVTINESIFVEECSPLFLACQIGQDIIVSTLVNSKYNVDVNLGNNCRQTPLFAACQHGHEKIMQILLDNHADANLCGNTGLAPLNVACLSGHKNMLESLLKNGAKVNLRKITTALYSACEMGNDDIVQILLKYNADVNLGHIDGHSPLHAACRKGNCNIAKHLLKRGADVNYCNNEGNSPLSMACLEEKEDIIRILLQNNADVDLGHIDGQSPLYLACIKGHCSIVELLLGNQADVNMPSNGDSPLHAACRKGYCNIATHLLKSGADVNYCNNEGNSPLSIACSFGYEDIVQLLLTNEADMNLLNEKGFKAVEVASFNGHQSIVNILLPSLYSE